VGGGYIGLELGSVYAALGTKVSVVEMTPGLLPGADRDLVRYLAQRVEKTFDNVMLSTKVTSMRATDGGASAPSVKVTFEGDGAPGETTYDYVLVSIGRRPTPPIAGLDKTHAQVNQRGFIQTDLQRRTEEPSIFAIGDIAGEPMLAHKASHEARVAIEAIAGHKAVFEPQAIPAVVFTDPEVAWAGLTETQAEQEGRKVDVVRFPWPASGRAIAIDRVDGMTKMVIDPATERVLGVGIVGSGAGELIAEGVLAIEMGATASDLKLTIHAHPTLSETIMESAEMFFGTATHVYKPRRK
jgi:dihydrolipoamide dehydrogenase